MSKPLVSIIIPTYNYAHLINETLESVIAQTYKNWECIIVDDGSLDNTEAVVQSFINHHLAYAFTYVKKINEGTSIAKNTGVLLAAGKYIQFLDADDLISPDKLSIQVKTLIKAQSSLVFSRSVYFNTDDANRLSVQKWPKGFLAEGTLKDFELLKKLITNNILTISAPLVLAEPVKSIKFRKSLKNNEDWLFWINIAIELKHFVFDYDERSITFIRLHAISAVNNKTKMFKGEVAVRKEIEAELLKMESSKDTAQLRKLNLDLLALHQVRSLNASAGMKYILSNFVKNPVNEFSLFTKALFKLGVRIYKLQYLNGK